MIYTEPQRSERTALFVMILFAWLVLMGFATWGRALGHPAPTQQGAFTGSIVLWFLFPFPAFYAVFTANTFKGISWIVGLAFTIWLIPTFWLWVHP